jgi:hypothetical protein
MTEDSHKGSNSTPKTTLYLTNPKETEIPASKIFIQKVRHLLYKKIIEGGRRLEE